MKDGMVSGVFAVLMLVNSTAGVADCKNPTTTIETNECTEMDYRAADAPSRTRLQVAQRAWLAFRDAHLAAMYPPEDRKLHGSARPMCTPLLLTELTVARTKQLEAYLERVEGDVCSP